MSRSASRWSSIRRQVQLRRKVAISAAYGLFVGLALHLPGCYRGGDLEDKEPPPGEFGGTCIDGLCNVGQCVHGQICYDPQDPCKGVYCGGHGTCFQDLDNFNVPVCVCDPGYQNETYAFFCTPG